jgi:hypothetical protein
MKRKAAHDPNDWIWMLTFKTCSIRILFSIADIDAPQDPPFEDAEGADGEDAPVSLPPIRCSIVISKASTPVTRVLTIYVKRPSVMAQEHFLECALVLTEPAHYDKH